MKVPKFKVGDKVKVLRASTDEEHDFWMDSWVHSMNRVIGEVCTITYCNLNNCYESDTIYPKYQLDKCALNFPEFILQKEVIKGEQLLLFEL